MIKYRKYKDYIGSIFSFGSGVQSTAIFLLIHHEPQRLLKVVGHLPEWIIFADTGAENQESIDNFEKCKSMSKIPMLRVKNFERNALNSYRDVPVFFESGGNMQRQCTAEWKIKPINRAISKLYSHKKSTKNIKKIVSAWLGISLDEISRMKESKIKSIENVYPLIELGLTRNNCYQILKKYNWNAVKSSCYMCPYQVKRWVENKEIDKAISYEKQLQKYSNYREIPFLHPSAQPLEEVYKNLKNQTNLFSRWDFENECDGVCGI